MYFLRFKQFSAVFLVTSMLWITSEAMCQPLSDVESYLLKSITGSYIPVYWLKPVRTNRKGDIILLLDDDGKRTAIESGGWADSLALKGYEVVIPDLSGFGELASGYIKGGDARIDKVPLNLWYMSILLDQSLLTVRMHELSFLIDWIRKSGLEINGVAKGVLTVDLLHIATMRSSAFSSLALISPLVSYQSLIEEANYKTRYLLSGIPEMIYQYDLGDLMNSLADRMPLLIVDPKDGAGETIGHGKGTDALDKNVNVTIAYDNNTLSGMLYDWYSSEK